LEEIIIKEIGVGIIGYGFMGKAHTYGYKTIPLYYPDLPFRTKLVGICDVSLPNALAAKKYNDFEFATDNAEDIFSRDDIHVVNICTPNIFHKADIVKAINSGKAVYCDKPLTVGYDEISDILSSLEKKSVVNQMALQYRFYPATMRAKELIEEGRLGRILSFRASYLHSGSVDPDKPIGWKQDKKIGGGGVLFDLGSHVLDLLYHLLGDYNSIFTMTETVYNKRPDKAGNMVDIDADDLSIMLVRMKNGGAGVIEASKVATGTNDELRFEIHGTKGAIRFNLMEPNWLDFYDNTLAEAPLGGTKGFTKIECVQRFYKPGGGFPSSKNSIGWIRGHVHCLYNFLSCVNEGKQASPSFKEGAYIQKVMDAAYESAEKSRWIGL
jgi:predicted dehydrogenase